MSQGPDEERGAGQGVPRAREIRERLSGARGPAYWRSLEELAGTPEFQEILHEEFPRHASEWAEGLDRRRFLQLSGATLALAGLTACTRQPLERIVPYVKQPEEIVPGRPLFYATAMTLGGYAMGLLVESHEGRPTKIEGNPLHPASLGATDAFAQASILGLYDPDRSQVLTHLGTIQTWEAFSKAIAQRMVALKALQGEGLRILTETVTSPTLADQIRTLLARYPKAKWHQWEPAGRDNVRAGAKAAFGRYVETIYDFSKADVVVSLDADFVMQGPGRVRYARDFVARRKVRGKPRDLCRLYMVESAPTNTGTLADHRLSILPEDVHDTLTDVLRSGGPVRENPDPRILNFMARAMSELMAARGRGILIPGEFAPAAVHELAHDLNARFGNVGTTVHYLDPVEAQPEDQLASLTALAADMSAGRVDSLLILGGNPVFTAPADLDFAQALLKVPLRTHLSLEEDETSEYCQWHVPAAHELEAWSDARAFDGTTTILQPLIEPLYTGKSAHEVLSLLLDDPSKSAYDVVRTYWKKTLGDVSFEASWRRSLHDGVLAGASASPAAVAVSTASSSPTLPAAKPAAGDAFEILFRPDPTIHDGRFANNGWLQELPKPLSKLTWDNAALLAPAAATRLGVGNGDVVEIAANGRSLQAPVWIQPGHPDGAVTLHLGYGRRRTGRVGSGAGFDVYALRTSAALWSAPGARITKTGAIHPLATTQEHFSMEGRHLVRVGTLEEYRHEPHFAQEMEEVPPRDLNFFPGRSFEGYAWGLSIDLSACTGCNACVMACASENNTPVVGKDQVMRGREMHWIRIDRYYAGEIDDPDLRTHHQPVMCMQCEQAPCEVVCPVAATNHSSEGLNDMVYNRCVGTRYCSNNCPYKVRRFNFLEYNGDRSPVLKLLHNPDVTVRSRGVMEKCTYCVQRINEARIGAERESRKLRDGEIVTACQQACPTEAIVFGDINDPASRVSRLKAEATNYGILESLNTRPRTTYLAKIVDPSPALGAPGIEPHEGHHLHEPHDAHEAAPHREGEG